MTPAGVQPLTSSDNSTARRINVIVVRDTAHLCIKFLRSVSDQTALGLTVVANGCKRAEEGILAEFCETSDKHEFYSLNSATTLKHGAVLDHLLTRETSDLFTFMDSDIFATGPVEWSDIEPLPGEVASTSGLPVWFADDDGCMPRSFQIMGGRFIKTESGHFLGCTFLASYRVGPLRALIDATGLSFGQRYHKDIRPEIREILSEVGLVRRYYDAGKLINILLQAQGHKMSYRAVPNLVHIGGISRAPARDVDPTGIKRAIKAVLPASVLSAISQLRFGYGKDEAASIAEFVRRQNTACDLARALCNGDPLPERSIFLPERETYAQELATVNANYSVAE